MTKLLIDEHPLIVLPSLAKAIGLVEAIILQQIHYRLGHFSKTAEDIPYTYATYEEWHEDFPFISVSTIKRAIRKLEKMEVLIGTDEFNKNKRDRKKWYTIDYRKMEELERKIEEAEEKPSERVKMTPPSGQNEPLRAGQNEPLYITRRDYISRDFSKNSKQEPTFDEFVEECKKPSPVESG